ncbi:MAG: cob(I)yrinic acid a,c-diamide adenosyltransferase [Candidatus Nanopelagicales bacterium]|jgi:cob(I)alamin adenosyltransferase|nr:cob(I)yrinic acid a,c-diamide adenosyltransferase [Candidatus Nanopelagicales bacterium]NKB91049.1 cob(I)yrinic acid a,c-diamide adenosyltransferase [Candidatus Nanopelagicales bacterium]
MVNLTRIYTRTGDDGTTSLGDMSRTGKNDPRLRAYADVDEANCSLGVILAQPGLDDHVRALLLTIQNDLFDVGADLCTPVVDEPEHPPLRITDAYISALETACDDYNERLEPLRSFVLPGGTLTAAYLHVARTVVRRAERTTWAALDTYHGGMNPLTATYLNRLSDLLFILARIANAGDDVLWQPGARS